MKRLLLALAISLCLAASLVPVGAGDIPVGGYCDTQQCVDANPAPQGHYWNPEYNVFHLHEN